MPPKYRTTRRPKRKFSGNQFTEPSRKNAMSGTEEANEEARGSNNLDQHSKKSVSSKKLLLKSDAKELKPRKAEEPYEEEATITGFRFVDMELLSTAFSAMRCADCGEFSIVLSENHLERKGCASSLRVFCENCGWKHEFWTSKKQTLSFEVNRRLDLDRVHGAEYKESDERKKRRKVLRGQRKKKEDKNQQAEGLTYAAGAF